MKVVVQNTVQKKHKEGKLDDVYNGTYYLVESLGKGFYKLKNQPSEEIQYQQPEGVRKRYV